jgi:uncharacterized protein Yka (UPF0111/DUF47 family)
MFSLQTIFGSGKEFYGLLEAAAVAAHESAKALHDILSPTTGATGLEAIKLARQRQREATGKISHALVDSFITPIEREDIEELRIALYKISKQAERFADRYALAAHRLADVDFAPRAAMLVKATGIVLEMVRELPRLRLDNIKSLEDQLHAIETEADRLLLELHREFYAGDLDGVRMFLLNEFFEILEKAIDRCRDAGAVVYQVALKNS